MNLDQHYDQFIEKAINWAQDKIGKEIYQFHCLAFVEAAYEESNHLEIFGGSSAKESAEEYEINKNKGFPEKGAFVFYDTFGPIDGVYKNWGHVGLHIGNGSIIHAWNRIRMDDYLEIQSILSAPGWTKLKYIGYASVNRIFEGFIKK